MNGPNEQPSGARILVIDDEEIIHTSLRRLLGRQGHEVDAVLRARDALKRLDDNEYDLLISDLMMPEMNGIQLLEALRERGLDVPVLMITGYPTIRTAVQALRLGAVDYLAKPFTRKELLGPVSRALRRIASAEADTSSPARFSDGIDAPDTGVQPGDRFFLREHSWAVFRQDGTMDIGVEPSFLRAAGEIASTEVPSPGDLVEQGHVAITLTTTNREIHGVFMPLSGQVVETNDDPVNLPGEIDDSTWVVRIIPSNLEFELELLRRS